MMRLILAAALAMGMSSFAVAGELDNESSVTNKELQGTLVLRVDTRTNEASYVQSAAAVTSPTEAQALVQNAEFSPVPESNVKSELDKDGGSSSWYFYNPYRNYGYGYGYGWGWNTGYRPPCNWYGNYYNPCYSYNYGYYNYYYYSPCWSYWR